jgi:hypothetical protein
MFVTAEEDADEVGRALKEVFGDVRPTATMIVGAKFVSPKMLVEIEADAIISWWEALALVYSSLIDQCTFSRRFPGGSLASCSRSITLLLVFSLSMLEVYLIAKKFTCCISVLSTRYHISISIYHTGRWGPAFCCGHGSQTVPRFCQMASGSHFIAPQISCYLFRCLTNKIVNVGDTYDTFRVPTHLIWRMVYPVHLGRADRVPRRY